MERLALVTLVVPDYDEALAHYVGELGFAVVEDTPLSAAKRWVVIRPAGSPDGAGLLLARAATPDQRARIGDQTGGRVAFFLHTTDLDATRRRFEAAGCPLLEGPRDERYGRVLVVADRFGNRWDLIQPA